MTPTQSFYKEVIDLYKPLEIIFEERNNLCQETEDELTYYCNSTVDRFCKTQKINDKKIREIIYQRLYEIKKMSNIKLNPAPRGAFYAFLDVSALFGKSDGQIQINSAEDFSNYLLEKFNVVVVQGEAFGCRDCIRISFALKAELLKAGLERIKKAAESVY